MVDSDIIESDYYVFLRGNLSEGFIPFGPYTSIDEAFDIHDSDEGWVMTVYKYKE